MPFYADLHIHSKYSRATSRNCDLEHLLFGARRKGIAVLGAGDFTHPEWVAELREKLQPAEPGLFRLQPDLAKAALQDLPPSCVGETRFILSSEISTIYKKGDKTRKVHHLILAPDFDHVARLTASLARVGNLKADGRPILGLDSRDLLEMVLESGEGTYLLPAHIWTPWFSALGSKSGFDAISECYGDLAEHIFAVETGLSSDPPMNWRLSSLDRYRLVSNSDAHSPPNLGRNACVFTCEMDYFAMRNALETGEGYGGTVEFYPEKGKYHLDGHRKCGVCLPPTETRRLEGRCPVCGKPLVVGVMHRVEALADRPEGARRPDADPFRSLIPLPEILSELERVGAGSKKVARLYESLLMRLGPELPLLEHTALDEVARHSSGLLVEALRRMRTGEVIREPGYDGEYGRIRLFTPDEVHRDAATPLLFPEVPVTSTTTPAQSEQPKPSIVTKTQTKRAHNTNPDPKEKTQPTSLLDGLDPEQRAAAQTLEGPVLIVAGPGTGKTRTLTHRLAYLIKEGEAVPQHCLAITFTRRAAQEMQERLALLLPDSAPIPVRTFHALGLELLREQAAHAGLPTNFSVADETEQMEQLARLSGLSGKRLQQQWKEISCCKREGKRPAPGSESEAFFTAYETSLREHGLVDFDDLLSLPVHLLESDQNLVETYRTRFRWICVDEYQDIDAMQYRLLRLLMPDNGNLCAIGDPDQAIYSFRGADRGFFQRFQQDYPGAKIYTLKRSYRCPRTILDASSQVMEAAEPDRVRLEALLDTPDRIMIHQAPTGRAEAEFVVQTMEALLGGHTLFSLDSGRSEGHSGLDLGFSDFAVLYRTAAQADLLSEALARSGIPFQRCSHQRLSDDPVVRELIALLRIQTNEGTVQERLDRAIQALRSTGSQEEFQVSAPESATQPDPIELACLRLTPLAASCDKDLTRFLDTLALGEETDCWDPRAQRVSLLTLHAAKGLEFPVVFITGCADRILPLYWGDHLAHAALEEERRLFYVGMTRAQARLVLSTPQHMPWRGKTRSFTPSPFLEEIKEQLLERRQPTLPHRPAPPSSEQMQLFP